MTCWKTVFTLLLASAIGEVIGLGMANGAPWWLPAMMAFSLGSLAPPLDKWIKSP